MARQKKTKPADYTPAMIAAICDAPWYWAAEIRAVAKAQKITVTSVTPIADVVSKLRGGSSQPA